MYAMFVLNINLSWWDTFDEKFISITNSLLNHNFLQRKKTDIGITIIHLYYDIVLRIYVMLMILNIY